MYIPDMRLGDLPVYVAVASYGHTVLAFGHVEDFGSAVEWCGRALRRLTEADQVAIARPTLLRWPTLGDVLGVVPFEGWKRGSGGWTHASDSQLVQFFDRVMGGATELVPEKRGAACGVMPVATSSSEYENEVSWEGPVTRVQVRLLPPCSYAPLPRVG